MLMFPGPHEIILAPFAASLKSAESVGMSRSMQLCCRSPWLLGGQLPANLLQFPLYLLQPAHNVLMMLLRFGWLAALNVERAIRLQHTFLHAFETLEALAVDHGQQLTFRQ